MARLLRGIPYGMPDHPVPLQNPHLTMNLSSSSRVATMSTRGLMEWIIKPSRMRTMNNNTDMMGTCSLVQVQILHNLVMGNQGVPARPRNFTNSLTHNRAGAKRAFQHLLLFLGNQLPSMTCIALSPSLATSLSRQLEVLTSLPQTKFHGYIGA